MASALSPDAPAPGAESNNEALAAAAAAPRPPAGEGPTTAPPVPERPWVCVPSDDFAGIGAGFRRNFYDFYGFRMRPIGSTHGASEYLRKARDIAAGATAEAAAATSSGPGASSSAAVEYEELFEVGIQYGDYRGRSHL